MRKMAIALTTTAAILFVGSLAWKADAQTARGAVAISTAAKNFTPIEKAATCGDVHCGPHRMLFCGVPPTGIAIAIGATPSKKGGRTLIEPASIGGRFHFRLQRRWHHSFCSHLIHRLI